MKFPSKAVICLSYVLRTDREKIGNILFFGAYYKSKKKMGWHYGKTVWRRASKAFAGACIIFGRLWYAHCADYTLVGIFGGSAAGGSGRLFAVFKLLNQKRDRQYKLISFLLFLLNCSCDFIGTHTSCADINRFYSSVFNNFHLFYIRIPFSVCTSTNLTTVNTNSVASDWAFFTNLTFRHCYAPPCLLM